MKLRNYLLLLMAAVLLSSCFAGRAGNDKMYGLQFGPQVPTGEFSDRVSPALGFTFQGYMQTSRQVRFGGTFTYASLSSADDLPGDLTFSQTHISLRSEIYYRFQRKGISPIIGGGFGYYFGIVDSDDIFFDVDNLVGWLITPLAGVSIPLSKKLQVNAVLKQDFALAIDGVDANMFSLNAGLMIEL